MRPTPAAPPAGAVQIITRRQTVAESLVEAWRCRHVLWALTTTSFTGMFDQVLLGPFWIPITIAVQTLGPALIFGAVLDAPTPSGIPYLLFFLVGMTVWSTFGGASSSRFGASTSSGG